MRFNEIIYNQIRVNDEIIEDYIKDCDSEGIEYSVADFIQYINDQYFISDLVEITDVKYTLREDNFQEEINHIKGLMNND